MVWRYAAFNCYWGIPAEIYALHIETNYLRFSTNRQRTHHLHMARLVEPGSFDIVPLYQPLRFRLVKADEFAALALSQPVLLCRHDLVTGAKQTGSVVNQGSACECKWMHSV